MEKKFCPRSGRNRKSRKSKNISRNRHTKAKDELDLEKFDPVFKCIKFEFRPCGLVKAFKRAENA